MAARWAAAGTLAAAVTLTGLPAVETAQAAGPPVMAKPKPGTGKRCDTRNGLPAARTTPPDSGFPDDPAGLFHKSNELPKNFDYPLPGRAFDGLKAPNAAQRQQAMSKVPGDPKKNVDAWTKQADKSGDPEDRAMEIYARFLANNENLAFDHWFEHRYIRNQTNNHKGSGFERQLVRDYKLVGPDWLCEYYVELFDKDGNKVGERRYDAYNKRTKEFNEFKSNSKLDPKQLAKDRIVAKSMPDHTFRFTGAKKFTRGQEQHIKQLDDDIRRDRPGTTNQVRGNQRFYNPVGRTTPIPGYGKNDTWMAPACQGIVTPRAQAAAAPKDCGSRGPLNDRINGSGRTLEEAKRIQADARRLDTRGTLPRGGPGGVDFTTLELRFVGGLGKGKGVQYSMKADMMPEPDENPGFGGQAKMQLASDALFTWLALTPEKFWVNLNPDQPDKIMDSKFAATDAGRILLDADLDMKFDFAEAINPDKHAGARRFWDTQPREDGIPCFPEVRMWIEPEVAQVREQDGGIYILDAPLKVSTEWMDVDWSAPGAHNCTFTEAEKRFSEANLRANVMPEVSKRVNNGAKYADLRRVYTSRVAAEYIRQQDAKSPTDFRPIIDSNDVSAWPLRAPNDKWTKQGTYDRYMKSLREGVEWFELEYGGKVYNQGVGGVDFSKSPKRNIPKVRFDLENRDLDNTTRNSLRSDDASYRDTDTLYLGGNTPTGDDDTNPTPTPTPTPTPSDRPSDTPTTPAPDPTTPPTGGGSGGSGGGQNPPKDPGGDLADTGSSTPVGLIAALAAALAALGGGLLWWKRRRTAGQE
ncbi:MULTISPECIES: LPXTG cell wall anchor domain-containing protein [Streptomyces]|uniref:LPXTG cell wall anchor domain-containing protein n=1 Tax=Streptomyces TaxID=1883 RepID=UPI001316648F|nr:MULTISPECIES: LPXTG cell wall anchor domain-containing protein [Streptomyces]QGZ50820.1 LPXTG cell wall anchor domain-containing protein [Streptomyces sp. QHH-9511]GGT82348.1 hypothetical protein GCM10010272_28610 [Streptomyces lateritius]